MYDFVTALREHQELAIFLTLAVGFFIGRLRFGTFSLGTVVGTLLAGVIIGQLDIKVSATVKNIFFDLFLFTTGYKVGPQFFRGLKKNALPQVAVTVVLCVTSLVTTLIAAHRDALRQLSAELLKAESLDGGAVRAALSGEGHAVAS